MRTKCRVYNRCPLQPLNLDPHVVKSQDTWSRPVGLFACCIL